MLTRKTLQAGCPFFTFYPFMGSYVKNGQLAGLCPVHAHFPISPFRGNGFMGMGTQPERD